MDFPTEPRILARPDHCISRRDIDPAALKVLYRLHRSGHTAYLVGGAVRDLLLRRRPKDYDIGTSATPDQVLDLFRNSRIIGRRFPIVHVLFGRDKAIEVSTFRATNPEEEEEIVPASDQDSVEEEDRLQSEADSLLAEENGGAALAGRVIPIPIPIPRPHSRRGDRGRHLLEFTRDIQYGTPAEDARRRDLTINGLFYDIADFSVIDWVEGLPDLDAGVVRLIGDPDQRILADPVRMVRVLRHAARADFRIEPATWAAVRRHRERLGECSKARVLEEFYRDLRGGAACRSLALMKESGLLGALLPRLDEFLPDWPRDVETPLPWRRLEILDRRIEAGADYSPAFLLGVLMTFPFLDHLAANLAGRSSRPDVGRLTYRFLKPLTSQLGVARRDTERLFLISISQRRLARCREGQPVPGFFRNKPYFAEARDLFLLDAEARGLELGELRFAEGTRRRRGRRRSRRGA
ncbi:MAG: hypothetical protein JW819_01420 [Candidatus Krumholzibacteriota bacterium]|nr:hypothetical protein [Candidatus Krumholzibacteriota bacterium]